MITLPFAKIIYQNANEPRHILQKSIEILEKINKFRKIKHFGEITIPLCPSRKITKEHLFLILNRLNDEVNLLIKKKSTLLDMELLNDNSTTLYEILNTISLSIDPLLGVRGFTPNDVYEKSVKIVKIIEFLQKSQNIHKKIPKSIINKTLHPNHSLYEANKLLQKISIAQKNLWLDEVEVLPIPQRVITSTEVYCYEKKIIAQLQRIKNRLGIERYFEVKKVKNSENRTSNEIVRNLNYALHLIPEFKFGQEIIQYNSNSLNKTTNELYSLSHFLIQKLNLYKEFKGIKVDAKEPPKIFSNKTIFIYQKIVENFEKIQKIREYEGLKPSSIPITPITDISINQLYDMLLRIDDELSLILKNCKISYGKSWNTRVDKKIYKEKTLANVYSNLWMLSNQFNTILPQYSNPNELFRLTVKIDKEVDLIVSYLKTETNLSLKNDKIIVTKSMLFEKSLELIDIIQKIQKRANLNITNSSIPQSNKISTNNIYHLLRLTNAMLIEIKIHFGIEKYVNYKKVKEDKNLLDIHKTLDFSYQKLLETMTKKH